MSHDEDRPDHPATGASTSGPTGGRVRLGLATGLAAALVTGAVVHGSPVPLRTGSLSQEYAAATTVRTSTAHHAATKNDLSRSDEAAASRDATTPAERAASAARVAAERAAAREPRLRGVRVRERRTRLPRDRYAMAGGCYRVAGHRLRFQATGLGSYLLHTTDGVLAATGSGAAWEADPSPDADWRARRTGRGRFTFTLADGRGLRRASTATGFATGSPRSFRVRRTTGCAVYPEVETNVSGRPFGGVTAYQEVRGWADPHVHGQTHEFLGGKVICSPPFHPYGAPSALVDCLDHRVADGRGALLEDALSGNTPGTGHDPVGWPTFEYWPAPHSLTHQQVYYKWLERAWRGGLRLHTSLLTENHVLCGIYPLKKNSCDDRDAVRLQAKRMRQMQDYVDAQHGGPGRGWFRIVTDPFQARRVINAGKLAVVMGMETSAPLGCSVVLGRPTCSEREMLRELAEMKRLGVSQMELTNKFDNAFTGVAGDEGSTGVLTNTGNFLASGSFLRMRTCDPANPPGTADKTQVPNAGQLPGSGTEVPDQDALFGAVLDLFGSAVPAAPLYPRGPHCNRVGLSPMGERLLAAMADHQILFDPDHMSVAGRNAALDWVEEQRGRGRHLGVVSSHSWSTPDAYPRIYALGGFVAPYAGDSTGFVEKWRRHLGWADDRYYFGFGFGSDMNGFGAQGDPRGADAPAPVSYPFTTLGGARVHQQRSGERVYDVNVDGVSHYGLYPDWVRDSANVAGPDGDALLTDLARGAEAYLQTWERAHGLAPDSCRNPELRRGVRAVRRAAARGLGPRAVMRRLGQPYERIGRTFTYCARTAGDPGVRMVVRFDRRGRVAGVRRSR